MTGTPSHTVRGQTRGSGDGGHGALLGLVVLAATALAMLIVIEVGHVTVRAARADAVADATALAAAGGGVHAASVVAERNGATVVSLAASAREATVHISSGGVDASARAVRELHWSFDVP